MDKREVPDINVGKIRQGIVAPLGRKPIENLTVVNKDSYYALFVILKFYVVT